jgi:glycosyltransferase involved in cell wall biosynthesis
MLLSVICPTYNESCYIENVLSFCVNAYPTDKEIIFIDGGSKDDTCEIINKWIATYPNIRLLHNPNRTVPFALNIAIPECKGDIIVRLDAHTTYASDYFEAILTTFEKSGADIVGGPTRTAFKNKTQEAVAYIICTSFGIGGSKVHDADYEGENDTVTFGAWKKDMFDYTGLFDTSLKRNQDDEFHYRARSKGLTIYQSSTIKLYYYPRSTLKSLFSQYYQYGLYKPLVLSKIKSGMKLRHLVPAIFVLYLVMICLGLLQHVVPIIYVLLPLIFYCLIAAYFALKSGKHSMVKVRIFIAYFALHISYGTGFLVGLVKVKKKY